jgi:hypothetical protein
VEIDAGTVARIESMVVVDTFGQQTLIHPTEVARPGTGQTPWRMFRNTGAPQDMLLVPPVIAYGLQGPDAEEVVFLRDETANMAWAIERKVTDPAGTVIDRYERWRARMAALPVEKPHDQMSYEVMTEVPDHWIPLVPKSSGMRAIRLDRGTVVDPSGATFRPLGRLLEPEHSLSLFEEELPRAGLAVSRAWQAARGPNGSTLTWIGRRKRPGRGEGSSGLAFDQLIAEDGEEITQ